MGFHKVHPTFPSFVQPPVEGLWMGLHLRAGSILPVSLQAALLPAHGE